MQSRQGARIVKTYPPRGPMQQYRFEKSEAFRCFRCGSAKKSKLHTIYASDWALRLCNGCYGYLLSIYDIKAGTQPDSARAEQLAEILLKLASKKEAIQAARTSAISQNRLDYLSDLAIRFLGTSEFVAQNLRDAPSLDWSAAVIGLCKAVEVELISRLIDPLCRLSDAKNIDEDATDPDLGRVARYCCGRTAQPPELGSIAHFLQTAIHSKRRAERSVLLRLLPDLMSDWPHSTWLLDSEGAATGFGRLAKNYRNRAAHIDDLNRLDYDDCFDFVAGNNGLLWRLVEATLSQRQANRLML